MYSMNVYVSTYCIVNICNHNVIIQTKKKNYGDLEVRCDLRKTASSVLN